VSPELEWKTRKERIDKRLKALSPPWEIIRYKEGMDLTTLERHAIEEFPTETGPADYALFVKGQLLGILEAKKVSVSPQNVLEQAKRYAKGALEGPGKWGEYRVPFLYASNGEQIWFLDVRRPKGVSRILSNFHTPAALQEFWEREIDSAYEWMQSTPIQQINNIRPYQADALQNIESSIIRGKRYMLVAMATGSGKTFTTVSQVYRLLKSGAAKRVLFLVDRKVLAAQAVREFAAFTTPSGNKFDQEYEVYSQKFRKEDFGDEDGFDPKVLPNDYLTNPEPKHTFVYVSTIQRMAINLFGKWNFGGSPGDGDDDNDANKLDIPIHAFDVIIADECHRGYTSKDTGIWRSTIQHFDAIKIGLTATPAPHTTSLFGEPVFRYTVTQAIEDGFLVDYDAVAIRSDVLINGAFLKEGEHVGVINTQTGDEIYDELEDERVFPSEDIEKKITAPDSNLKIIQEIAKYAYAHEKETDHFPKILIFAVNDLQHTSHADQLVTTCREVFGQGDDFVKKITGNANVDRPLQRIREFRNRPNPKVVVTVDMLTTGVDIPSLEFLVFMRPVKSRILWEQMLGRGTRRCLEINKTHFTIFDCFDGTLIDYFRQASHFELEVPQKEAIPIKQVIENVYQNIDRDYHIKVLVKRLHRVDKNMSGEAREDFSQFIPEGDMAQFASTLRQKIKDDFTNTLKLLRDPVFQKLLLEYKRAQRVFLKGYEVQDEVASEYKFRLGDSMAKPQDYLEAFSNFARENTGKIEAIKILMDRPKNWSTQALEDLIKVLKLNSFPVQELQKAHELVHHKPIADIISMVKHSIRNEEPLLNAQERVDRALKKVTQGRTFDPEQQQWLGYIREHLVANLTIDEDDFEYFPVFELHGGLVKVRKVFPDQFQSLLGDINLAVAA